MKKNLAVTLIELPSTVDGRLDGKLAKDIYSLLYYPARGVPLLLAEMKQAGARQLLDDSMGVPALLPDNGR